MLNESPGTIKGTLEPFLIQKGYLDRTPRGRVATVRAYEHFGIDPRAAGKAVAQAKLL